MVQQTKKQKFKVRDMMTGLYQDDKFDLLTREYTWSKRGKTWSNLEDLATHFALLEKCQSRVSPFWEIVDTSSNDIIPAVSLSKAK